MSDNLRELARLLPDVARLLVRLMRDERVPWHGKAVAAGAAAYVVSPIDVLPDVVPVIGKLDDVFLVVRALRHLTNTAGYDVVRELWPGTDDGFLALMVLTGMKR